MTRHDLGFSYSITGFQPEKTFRRPKDKRLLFWWAIVFIVFLLFLFFNLRGAITFKGGQKLFRAPSPVPPPCSRKPASHGGLVKKSVSHTSLLFDKTLKRRSIDRIFSWTTILRDHDRACRHKFTVVALNSI